jgi:hypothetical protein
MRTQCRVRGWKHLGNVTDIYGPRKLLEDIWIHWEGRQQKCSGNVWESSAKGDGRNVRELFAKGANRDIENLRWTACFLL